MAIHATVAARSDVGKSRAANEDYFAIRSELGLFLVADGMGGHGNGEVASQLAARSVCETISALRRETWLRTSGTEKPAGVLRDAFEKANHAVFRAVDGNAELSGMGATMVALLLVGQSAIVAHAGDSRAYRVRAGELSQLTEDHTWVGQQVTAGELSADEARQHPFRNVVTRALGGEANLLVDVGAHDVRDGDIFLLCSDGLTGVVSDERIVEIVDGTGGLDGRCAALIDAANEGGGPDNITAVLVSCSEVE